VFVLVSFVISVSPSADALQMIVLNRRGVLAGAALLGEGLVASVTVNRE
jgi:hypothetical protein